jgi:HD-GYP domain-containing protein (c-di-GMP phosphodiesterase class II)
MALVAVQGLTPMSVLISLAAAAIAAVMVAQVYRAVVHLRGESQATCQAAAKAEKHYVDCLLRIVRFIESRDPCLAGRSQRIGALADSIGRRMGLDARHCEMLHLAGELHDIGMIAVPRGIIGSRSSLGVKDMVTVREHAGISHQMLSPLESLKPILPAIRHHHERMNGTGYPDGLSGTAISLEARILAVADAYDAMTHDRPYRPAMTPLAAMEELTRCSPDGFDADCVQAIGEVVNVGQLKRAEESCGVR